MNRFFALTLLGLTACSPATTNNTPRAKESHRPIAAVPPRARITPHAPFRAAEPPPDLPSRFYGPVIETWSLKNGVRVMLVERHSPATVSIEVIGALPGDAIPNARPGVRALAAWQCRASAPRNTRELLADFSAWAEPDALHIRAHALASDLSAVLDAVATMVVRPTFDQAEIDRSKQIMLDTLKREGEHADVMANRSFGLAVYGAAHPYGTPTGGRLADFQTITREEIERAYEAELSPATTTIVVAGDVTTQVLRDEIGRRFDSLPVARPAHPQTPTPSATATSARIIVVDRGGMAQSRIVFGGLVPPRRSDDWLALGVLNGVLGGNSSGRLVRALREERGFIYYGSSLLTPHRGDGSFRWQAEISPGHAADALREIDAQLRRVRREVVTEGELAAAKEWLRASLPMSFDTSAGIAAMVSSIPVYRLGVDEYDVRQAKIDALRADDLLRVARAYLEPERMKVVLVGDWSTLRPELLSLGWGPIEIHDETGALRTTVGDK